MQTAMNSISIIVPVYNAEKYLDRCIESLLMQTYKELEIILVDDGSADNSGLKCDSYANSDSRIKVIHKENGGVSSARNAGIEAASGKWLMFVDSDDYIETDTCEFAVSSAEAENSDMLVFEMIFEGKSSIRNSPFADDYVVFDSKEKLDRLFLDTANYKKADDTSVNIFLGPCCKLIRRDIAKNTRFDKSISYGEDTLFVLELIEKCSRIVYKRQWKYHYVQVETSLTHKVKPDFIKDVEKLDAAIETRVQKHFGEFREEMLYGNYAAKAEFIIVRYMENSYKLQSVVEVIDKYVSQPKVKKAIEIYRPYGRKKKILWFFIKHRMYGAIWLYKNIKRRKEMIK